MKRLGVLVALVLAIPLVAAQADVDAELLLRPDITVDDLRIGTSMRDQAAFNCGAPNILRQPEFDAIRFTEGYGESGCAELWIDVAIPQAAQRITVAFAMDRDISDVRGQATVTPNAVQQLVFRQGTDEIGRFPIFARNALPSPKAEPFSQSIDVPDAEAVTVAWHLEDMGIGDERTPSGQSLQSILHDIDISFSGIPLAIHADAPAERLLADTVDHRQDFHFELASHWFEVADPEVELTMGRDVHIIAVETPLGVSIDASALDITLASVETLRLPGSLTATHGPGTYTLLTQQLRPAVADAAMAPIAGTGMFLPILGAGFAAHQYTQVKRQAENAGRRLSTGLRVSLVGVALVYALVLLFLFVSQEYWNLLVSPLPLAGIGYFLTFVTITAGFVVVALVGARGQAKAIEQEVDELLETKSKLERSNHDLEHFAYIASHDLQEPLRTISGFSQLLQRRYGDQIPEGGQRYLEKTIAGSQRMQQLIGDLLAYSRITTQNRPIEPVDVGKVIDAELDQIRGLIRETGAKVHRSAMPTLPGDEHQLGQVFSNLIRNAIKYSDPKRPPAVDIGAVLEGAWWHITVKDNGVGIPADQFERIFVIFQRLAPRTDTSGTGIGLSIVQRVVERHGGRIWLESTVGKGTTFHLRLPAGTQHD